jgi:hypothetical protein
MPSVPRPSFKLLSLAIAAALAAGAAAPFGCSSDDTTSQTTTPKGDMALAIVTPDDGACVAVGESAAGLLPIRVTTENIDLRPPGLCGAATQCGHLGLYVDGTLNNRGSSAVVPVRLDALGETPAERLRTITIIVRLLDDAGTMVLDPTSDAGALVEDTIMLTTAATCPDGAGGGGGTGGEGGSAGQGGHGGTGGSGTTGGTGGSGGARGAGGAAGSGGGGGSATSGGAAGAGGAGGG